MKKIFHKNQVIITALAFLIAVAGYISYEKINMKDDELTQETNAKLGLGEQKNEYTIDNANYEIFEEIDESLEAGMSDTETGAEIADASGEDGEFDIADSDYEGEISEESDEIVNPGETVLTSLTVTSADYAAEVKLNREQVRSKNKEALLEIIDNETLTEEQKQDAIDEMVTLTDIAEKEANAQMLLEAKGFTNVVVSIDEESCDVVLDMGDVTDAKRAQVEDIVKRKTGISAEHIVITPISTSGQE